MPIDKAELRKLSPEARIKKLKELEEEGKKEIEEASDLIKRTEAEIAREKDIPDMEVPDIKPVDISKLFESPEGLESTVKQEAPEKEEQAPIKYGGIMEQGEGVIYNPPPDGHDWAEVKMDRKFEDSIKYESATQKGADLTGSTSVLKNIKKYTMG